MVYTTYLWWFAGWFIIVLPHYYRSTQVGIPQPRVSSSSFLFLMDPWGSAFLQHSISQHHPVPGLSCARLVKPQYQPGMIDALHAWQRGFNLVQCSNQRQIPCFLQRPFENRCSGKKTFPDQTTSVQNHTGLGWWVLDWGIDHEDRVEVVSEAPHWKNLTSGQNPKVIIQGVRKSYTRDSRMYE